MMKLLDLVVLMILLWSPKTTGNFQTSGFDLVNRRTRRDVYCREHEEYRSDNICCLNCPAGYRLTSPCTEKGGMGSCERCDDGTYTDHSNALKKCLDCTKCHSDQNEVKQCSRTQDTQCQCKPGRFCAPDQPCETCRKCSKCEKDEEVVRNCTSTTNTVCRKTQPDDGSTLGPEVGMGNTAVIVPLSLLAVVVLFVFVLCLWRKKATESQRNQLERLKAGQHYSDSSLTEERRDALRPSSVLILPGKLEDEEFPKLVPVHGEESLRRCFEYFEEIDVDYHKRFFRYLGISDNVIKSKEHLPYEDRIHELLNIWIEKEGKESSLNDLLKALLALNQRRTAEIVKENAIANGHYHL